jgi:hypothetical protein
MARPQTVDVGLHLDELAVREHPTLAILRRPGLKAHDAGRPIDLVHSSGRISLLIRQPV